MAIKMADCQVILVATDKNYQLRPAAIEEAITEKTKAVVTISPNNPTGVVYPENTLREVNRICQKRASITFTMRLMSILPITMPATFPQRQLLVVKPGLFPYLVSQKPTVLPVGALVIW
jgi:hypothetical protein